jgi:hypothetical protein
MARRQGQSYSEDLRAQVLAAVDGDMAARVFRVSVTYSIVNLRTQPTFLLLLPVPRFPGRTTGTLSVFRSRASRHRLSHRTTTA